MSDPKNISIQEHAAIHAAIDSTGASCGLCDAAANGAAWSSNNANGDVHHGTYETQDEAQHGGKKND